MITVEDLANFVVSPVTWFCCFIPAVMIVGFIVTAWVLDRRKDGKAKKDE